VFDFYRASGFVYPAKLAALQPRLSAIEGTWNRLLARDSDVFRFAARYALADGRSALANAACAYESAPGSWQCQHLVSAERHEYSGTLAVLTDLIGWCHDSGADYVRAQFRPNNPGVSELFGIVAERLPRHLACLSTVDYGMTAAEAVRLSDDNDVDVGWKRGAITYFLNLDRHSHSSSGMVLRSPSTGTIKA